MSNEIVRRLGEEGVVPVVVIDDAAAARPLAEALAAGGLHCAEVTLRTPAALDALRAMAELDDFLVGAGTVLDPAGVDAAAVAGAAFIVSPGLDEDVLARCRERRLPAFPGVATATETMRAARAGIRHVKFFPAAALGGVPAIEALASPFPTMRFMPTGGIDAAAASRYLASPAVFAVGGSWMVPPAAIAARDWTGITRLAAGARSLADAR